MKRVAEETESHACAVWLMNEDQSACDLWMAIVQGRLYSKGTPDDYKAIATENFGKKLDRMSPIASGKANCSPLTPLTKWPPRISPRASSLR